VALARELEWPEEEVRRLQERLSARAVLSWQDVVEELPDPDATEQGFSQAWNKDCRKRLAAVLQAHAQVVARATDVS